MTSLQWHCKPPLAASAKCLKYGADWRSRTPDPLITNRVASLKIKAKFVNRRRDAPAITDTYRAGVNRQRSFSRLSSSRSTASRMKSERFSFSASTASMRAIVPARNRPGVCSSLIFGLPTPVRISDITFSSKQSILLISPIDAQSDITYIGDIRNGASEMVGIGEMKDSELQAIIDKGDVGTDAYICACNEVAFRHRHPEYRVA